MKLGLAAGLQAGVLLRSHVVPKQQLFACCFKLTGVQFFKQRGSRQLSRTKIEREVHQRIELSLRENNPHQPLDGLLGPAQVAGQHLLRLGFCNASGIRFVGQEPVTIAYGRNPGSIQIGAVAKTLRPLEQIKACRAHLHRFLPFAKPDGACLTLTNSRLATNGN